MHHPNSVNSKDSFTGWENLCETILGKSYSEWEPLSKTDWDTLNPIYHIFSFDLKKSVRIIGYSTSNNSSYYGMYVKKTTKEDLPDDSIDEFVFTGDLNEVNIEVFKIFFTIWVREETDYSYMDDLLKRFQRVESA